MIEKEKMLRCVRTAPALESLGMGGTEGDGIGKVGTSRGPGFCPRNSTGRVAKRACQGNKEAWDGCKGWVTEAQATMLKGVVCNQHGSRVDGAGRCVCKVG